MNVLIIGVGHHARRIYIPSLDKDLANLVFGLDLRSQREFLEEYIEKNLTQIKMYYTDDDSNANIKGHQLKFLNSIIKENNIGAVIISTDPPNHYKYAKWALEAGIHVLMDKPVTSEHNVCSDLSQAKKIIRDYAALEKIYKEKRKQKHIVFSMMSQRRYHPLYIKIKEKISEVFAKTNCPITSIQTSHCDGQWRTPDEIVDIQYHGYNCGYGKCSHSGYHTIDMVTWFLSAAESVQKKITSAEIFTSFLKPSDFLHQLSYADYKNIFVDFEKNVKYSESDFLSKTKSFGEIDAFSNITFRSGKHVQTLGSLNLIHNGFSQRGWLSSEGRNLYKANGRIRQEQYFLEQGPFQSISLITYQSNELGKEASGTDLFAIGKEFHAELHIFRNSTLFPEWKTHEIFNMKDYADMKLTGYSRGHQEDARKTGVIDFFDAIKERRDTKSDFLDHKRGTTLLSAIYQSSIKRNISKNALVEVDFT